MALIASACGDDLNNVASPTTECFADPDLAVVEAADENLSGTTITLATHDSFLLSPSTLESFTAETGIQVEQIAVGDAGQLVSQAILTRDNPTADVMFGIDNTFLCRGLLNDLFLPYISPGLEMVDDALELDPYYRVTPVDFGDVCVNYWIDALPGEPPAKLDDLTDPLYVDEFVTQNPETSSPGFAFLLATIARFDNDGWEQYWRDLVENDVLVTAGWNESYNGDFVAGGGTRSLVTSYASSPPAAVIFADPPIDEAPTGVLTDGCFRQIEFAGILAGTDHPEAAAALIDFMLGTTWQEDVPLNMFVYPANVTSELPEAFVQFGAVVDQPLTIDPAEIEANRDDWIDRWNEIVLG